MASSAPRRLLLALAASAAALLASLWVGLNVGAEPTSIARALGDPQSLDRVLIVEARLPRVLLGAVAGGGLATAGAALQALLRNPLAEPYVLGVSGGAALGASVAIALGASALSALGAALVPAAAVLGGMGSTALVYLIARASGPSGATLLLAGVIVNALASALITFVKSLVSASRAQELLFWLMGFLDVPSPRSLIAVALCSALGSAALCLDAGRLHLLSLGDEPAAHVGVDVRALERRVFFFCSLVVGAVVSATGLIGFVGLVVPHLLRRLSGPDPRALLPLSFLLGAAALVSCDALGRLSFRLLGTEPPVGAITALLGGPLFLLLLARNPPGFAAERANLPPRALVSPSSRPAPPHRARAPPPPSRGPVDPSAQAFPLGSTFSRYRATAPLRPMRGLKAAVLWVMLAASAPARAHEVQPPRPLEQPVAAWPKQKPSEHDVIVPVLLVISAEGEVKEAQVEVSLGADFDREALAVARRWRFEPARRGDRPVESKIRAAVRFVGQIQHTHGHGADHAHDQGAGHTHDHGADHDKEGTQGGHSHPHAHPTSDARGPAPVRVVGHGEGEHREVRVQGERQLPGAASATSRDRAVIRAAPHRTGSDLLLVIPGVTVTQHSGEGKAYQIFFRGFDAEHGQDIELWAGGAPVNDVSNIHGQGYADLHFVMPEIVREIQSTPGTYDPRQGDFAVAGTMRLSLGYDEPGVTAKIGAGSFGARRYFLAYHPRQAPEETFAAFELYSTDGFGPSRAARRVSAVAQAVHDVGDHATARVLVTHHAGRFASAGVVRLDDIEQRRIDDLGTYDPRQGGDSSRSQLVLELSESHDAGRWSLSPFVVLRSMRLRSNFTGFLESESGDGVQQTNDAVTAGLTGSYRRPLKVVSSRDLVEAGIYARSDSIEQSQRRLASASDEVTATEVDARIRATNIAGYVDAALYPHRRLALRAGLRADGLGYTAREATGQARSAQGAHLGKKASAELTLLTGLSAAFSYGEGFRSPQARSLAEGQKTPFTSVRSYEAGLRFRDDAVRGSVALFRTELSDDLAFDQARARNERTPPTLRQGLAAEMVARPERWFTSSLSLTYTRATFRATEGDYVKGALLPYVPQLVGRADMAFEPRLGTLLGRPVEGQLGTGLTLFHDRPMPYGETGHDAFLVDLRAGAKLGQAQLTFDVTNALDARWFDGEFSYASRFDPSRAASLVPGRHVTLGPPRIFMLSLTLAA